MKNQLKQNQDGNPAGQNGRLICIYFFLIFLSFPHAAAQSSNQAPPAYPLAFGYYYFNSSLLVIIVIIVCAFLLLFFISVCLHRCYRVENDASVQVNNVESQMSRRRRRGLDPAVIEAFPTFAYSHVKDHKLGNGALECAVCLNEFEDEDKIRLLPKCDHVYHGECIDAWLSKHTTCPVCRADLVPAPGETPVITEPVQDIEGDFHGENPITEEEDVENEQVFNVISEEPQTAAVAVAPEVINQTPMQNRPVRSMKPRFLGRFPRSHSTGHSLVQPGEDLERFTLRLPDDVRKQIMNMRQLNRARSMESFPGLESPRKGYRMTDQGSNRGEKSIREKPEGWVFSVTPPFLMRAFSPRAPKIITEGDAPSTPRSRPFMSPLRVFARTDRTGLPTVPSPV